jgi:AmmeMemoRadiSam system protein B
MFDIRPPAVAGMFYPAEKNALIHQLDELFSAVKQQSVTGTIVAIVSPHAGYRYSGFTAAHGYSLLKGKSFDTVVIVSPSHREYFEGICVFSGKAYRTPLGELQVDTKLRAELLEEDDSLLNDIVGHRQEHAIEVQLPFLQRIVGDIKILPLVMGDQKRSFCTRLGDTLAKVLRGKNILLVASTDLSHYYSYDTAEKLDSIFINNVARFDDEQLMSDLEAERTEGCGGGPTVAVLRAAKKLGAHKVHILHHCNSGDITGDKSGVVGYLSAAIVRTK